MKIICKDSSASDFGNDKKEFDMIEVVPEGDRDLTSFPTKFEGSETVLKTPWLQVEFGETHPDRVVETTSLSRVAPADNWCTS